MPGLAGQERFAGQRTGDARSAGTKQTQSHPAERQNTQAQLDPDHTADDILQDDRRGKHQSADKAAAGCVMAAHQEIHRHHQGQRQNQARQYGRNHGIAFRQQNRLRCGFSIQCFSHSFVTLGRRRFSRFRIANAFRRRPETAQQGKYGQRNNDQHRDFTKGIETAKINEDDIDDIPATTLWQRALDEKRGNPIDTRTAHDRVAECRKATAAQHGQQQVAQPPQMGAYRWPRLFHKPPVTLRQPAQPQEDQHGRHHFDSQLGQR